MKKEYEELIKGGESILYSSIILLSCICGIGVMILIISLIDKIL